MLEEKLIVLIKKLYVAQFLALEAYEEHIKDSKISEELREEIITAKEDHERHKEVLGNLLTATNVKLPTPPANISLSKWGDELLAPYDVENEAYYTFQKSLVAEDLLIDLYDIGLILAGDNEEVVLALEENQNDDVTHSELFKETILQYAEEAAEK